MERVAELMQQHHRRVLHLSLHELLATFDTQAVARCEAALGALAALGLLEPSGSSGFAPAAAAVVDAAAAGAGTFHRAVLDAAAPREAWQPPPDPASYVRATPCEGGVTLLSLIHI